MIHPNPISGSALERAVPLLRAPGAPDVAFDLLPDGAGVRDPATGRVFPFAGGVLDLLGDRFAPTTTQRLLDTRGTAWLYDRLRDALAPALGLPDFATEASEVAERLSLAPGDVVLDIACGHGNFTVEIARRVEAAGLVVGLDISAAMLARAARRVSEARLANVLLVRGDALALPFAAHAFPKVLCSGGLHQIPDLERALAEMARVTAPGGRFAGSGFAQEGEGSEGWRLWLRRRIALHFVPLAPLARALEAAGFEAVSTRYASPFAGYVWARRAQASSASV